MTRIGWAVVVTMALGAGAAGAQESLTSGVGVTPPAGAETIVRITSPLGRTSTAARIRIVAQIERPPRAAQQAMHVRFYVDQELVGTVETGPPYAVEWFDENPFEAREIVVEAEEVAGPAVRDRVLLPAFELVSRAEVASILLEAGVYDATGRPVGSLAEADFQIQEDERPQAVDLVARESLPATVVLLVDNSQSMARRMEAVRHAAGTFARGLGPDDQIIVAPFTRQVGTITGPTRDVPTVAEAIAAMRAGGGTAILDAIAEGTRLLDGADGRRAIVMITDGFDENSTLDVDEVLEQAQAAQVTVYAVAIGGVTGVGLLGENVLRELTDRTGGRVFFPWRDSELAGVSSDVAEDAHSRYLITYTPTNQRKDGAWRTISVGVPEGYTVRTRTGYRAPSPPPIRPTIEFIATNAFHQHVSVAVDDLEVLEDGVPQEVDTFQEAVDPVSLVLALDASGSMVRSADAVRQTAREFVDAVRPEDSLALITFADEPIFGHVLSTNRAWTYESIDDYVARGGTALYDALWNSLMHLKPVRGRRAVVVLTDGRDEDNPGTGPGSAHTFDEVLALAREVGAVVFPIGLGRNVDRAVLERIAAVSGGEAYFSPDPEQLGAQFSGIVQNLRQRYVLSYTSTNADHDGAWRTVEIRPRHGGLAVAATRGYFAPEE